MQLAVPDSSLVIQYKNGNVSAYEELISRYTDKVFRLAMRITRSQDDAEEVLQDVCVAVFDKLDTFEGKSAFSSWLYRITANTALMKLRKRKKHMALELDESILGTQQNWNTQRSDISDVNYMTIRHELREALREAINSLPDDYRTIFILRDVDGLSNQEVGDVMELSVPAVKSRLHRSRMILRRALSEFHHSPTLAEEADTAEEQSLEIKHAA